MSSILPFVVVAVILVIVARMAVAEADQPATDEDRGGRDPWRERIRPLVQWSARSARDVRTWLLAGGSALRAGWGRRRDQRRAKRGERQARRAAARLRPPAVEETPPADPVAPPGRPSADAPAVVPVVPPPEGVVRTALRVGPDLATTEAVGEEVPVRGPGLMTRLGSTVGLVLLVALLGLALAVILGALASAVGSALDEFVN